MYRPKIIPEAVELVKAFEGCRLKAYLDPVGVPTIGYGLTDGALPGVSVRMGMTITQSEANQYLMRTLELFADRIWPGFTRQPTAYQFGAMLSLAYNIGAGAFLKSTALKRFNAGDTQGAAEAMTWWNKAGGEVLRGLVRRREAEVDLFLSKPVSPVADVAETSARPDPMRESPATSTTVLATGVAGASGAGGVIAAVSQLEGTVQIIVVVAACIAGLALLWINRERLKKWDRGVR